MNHRQLTRLFESGATDTAIDEILFLTTQIQPTFHTAALRQLHDDITRLFTGSYPGFQASNTRYHNLVQPVASPWPPHVYCTAWPVPDGKFPSR